MARKRYAVRPCDNLGTVADAKRDRQWDVIDTHDNDRVVSTQDSRDRARDDARELNKIKFTTPVAKDAPAGSEEHVKRYAASVRVSSAIEHLENARGQLDSALADISSIIGAHLDYARIRRISNDVIEARRFLDANFNEAWKLDHMPKGSKNVSHGCHLATLLVIALSFVFAGCFGDDVHTRPDASPKYDACDPTISKDCIAVIDARNCLPTRLDAGSGQMCTEPCEQLGCTRDQYEPSCTKGGTVCECNGMQCVGTP